MITRTNDFYVPFVAFSLLNQTPVDSPSLYLSPALYKMLSFDAVDLGAMLQNQQTLCTAFSVRSIHEHRDALMNGVPDPSLLNQIAATIIQAYWRRYASTQRVERLREAKVQEKAARMRESEDDARIVMSQCAVRRHLANKAAKEKQVSRQQQLAQENGHFDWHKGSKVTPTTLLPPLGMEMGATNNDSNEQAVMMMMMTKAPFEAGEYARDCAAIAIQAQVRRRLVQKKIRSRTRIKSIALAQFTRKMTLNRSTPTTTSMTVPRGTGLGTVFWGASGCLLDPRRGSTSSSMLRPGSASSVRQDVYELVGLQILHEVAMLIRKEDPTRLPELPITLWVSGPLVSQAERRRRIHPALNRRSPTLSGSGRVVVARSVAHPEQTQNSVALLATPRGASRQQH